jgi:phosphosulfolactate phosphohydrolase-like enzyme
LSWPLVFETPQPSHGRRPAFEHFRNNLAQALRQSVSGKELIERGSSLDIDIAAELNVSGNVPRLTGRAFAQAFVEA